MCPRSGTGPSVCEEGGGGFLLPLFGDAEQRLAGGFRGAMYMVAMLYCFLGVSIIADIFMSAIEQITSHTRKVTEAGQTKTVRVWNETVANLTLMALGSSAPEILLSLIEVCKSGFYSGELGPSTIVGSAAFNLLVIVAVCVGCLPDGEIRRIKELGVFAVTAAFSIFAYVWLVVIVQFNSKDVVEVWEGVATFLFFPLLVALSYYTDIGVLSWKNLAFWDRRLAAEYAMERKLGSCHRQETSPRAAEVGQGRVHSQHDLSASQGSFRDQSSVASPPVSPPRKSRCSTVNTIMSSGPMSPPRKTKSRNSSRSDLTRAMTGSKRVYEDKSLRGRDLVEFFDDDITWRQQVYEAVHCNGSWEAQAQANSTELLLHMVALPWKLLYALLVPPKAILGGWACFIVSILQIGALTAVIGDLAELFGCVVGLEDSITALTFVALGTSMPDLFASKAAATQDEWADASIVNVTGSNSVNVFLGIGLPWMMASIYWSFNGATDKWRNTYSACQDVMLNYPSGAFVVPSGNLTFSVSVFALAALICLALLVVRRRQVTGELGGPCASKVLSTVLLITLWILYIGLSIWKIKSQSEDVLEQLAAVLVAGLVLLVVMFTSAVVIKCFALHKGPQSGGCGAGDPSAAASVASTSTVVYLQRLSQEQPHPQLDQANDPELGAAANSSMRQASADASCSPSFCMSKPIEKATADASCSPSFCMSKPIEKDGAEGALVLACSPTQRQQELEQARADDTDASSPAAAGQQRGCSVPEAEPRAALIGRVEVVRLRKRRHSARVGVRRTGSTKQQDRRRSSAPEGYMGDGVGHLDRPAQSSEDEKPEEAPVSPPATSNGEELVKELGERSVQVKALPEEVHHAAQ